MITALLIIALLALTIYAISQKISLLAIMHYMTESGYKLPDDAEIKQHTEYAAYRFFKIVK